MHFSELTAPERRVLGCLIEKRWTTPEQYPLSLNALRLACNQATNRDPVTDYDEHTVREAAERLSKYGLTRMASGHGSRSLKFRHLAEEALGLDRQQLAVLAVMLLRGPQTPGELKQRSERMAPLDTLADVDRVLGDLQSRGYARRIERRPGQKEDRFEQLLGGVGDGEAPALNRAPESIAVPTSGTHPANAPGGSSAPSAPTPIRAFGADPPGGDRPAPASTAGETLAAPAPAAPTPAAPPPAARTTASPPDALAPRVAALEDQDLDPRITSLENEVAELRSLLEALRDELGVTS